MATLQTLASFDGDDGREPIAGVILDAQGNLFGTTLAGGDNDFGTVFELPFALGGYGGEPDTLVSFDDFSNGEFPFGGLTLDPDGDLFGTTDFSFSPSGGTVFEIFDHAGTYGDTANTLTTFSDTDGHPTANLIIDGDGNLFGTTAGGGTDGDGAVFELPATAGGFGSPTDLVSFSGTDGQDPNAGLITDADGDLFGTTDSGGASSDGTVFEVNNDAGDFDNTPTTLASFSGVDGAHPDGGLVMDDNGDLFGTTREGGDHDDGAVFEIPFDTDHYEAAKTLVSFTGDDGSHPHSSLIIDANGNLFGTTVDGGDSGNGTVFEITYDADKGEYADKPTTLVSFSGDNDGANPYAALSVDSQGDLFGTTSAGGADSDGTVFEITDSGFQVACYGRGTQIRMKRGEKPVERLQIGDEVMTMSGALRPIKWIGTRSYGGRFVIGRKDILPVCFKAGSLEDNVPKCDLWISPRHAMYLEGVLIEAKDLVNGVSIVQEEQVESVEYFHVELDSHDVIIAEGSLSESFVDDDSRGMFHNAHEYSAFYPDAPQAPARYCAPRLDSGYPVETARQRINVRAGLRAANEQRSVPLRGHLDVVSPRRIAGWAQNPGHPEAPVCLEIYVGGQLIGQTLANRYREDLSHAGLGSGNHSFEFTPPARLHFASASVEVRRAFDGAALAPCADAQRIIATSSYRTPRRTRVPRTPAGG